MQLSTKNPKQLAEIALLYVLHGYNAFDLCMDGNFDAEAHCMIFIAYCQNAYEKYGLRMGVN